MSGPELELREWFLGHASKRGLEIEIDRNGLIWAWDCPDGCYEDAVVTGSHLDSVPGGGTYDGPLGIASALIAFDLLSRSGVRGRPRAIVVFPEEEGSRFGQACLGSRLMTGSLDPAKALSLRDDEGVTLAEVLAANGVDPNGVARDDERLARIGSFVELHIEQGKGLVDLDRPVAVASSIIEHGRWHVTFRGLGNHAGTTLMLDRVDPMVAASRLVVAVDARARELPGARATVGRLVATPGGTNVIASQVDLWLDIRHPRGEVLARFVQEVEHFARVIAGELGCAVETREESKSPRVDFDPRLRDELLRILPEAPLLETAAGHDAGVLAEHVPTAMLFVRNPSGVSHAPSEHADDADLEEGAAALSSTIERLQKASSYGSAGS